MGNVRIEKGEKFYTDSESNVTLTETGNIFKMRCMKNNVTNHIKKVDRDNYIEIKTGEVKEYNHCNLTRADNLKNVRKSFNELRDIINTNVTNPKNCLFVTLTYAEKVIDTNILYQDFRKFNMRFKRFIEKNKYPSYVYVCVAEPQARMAWHCHVIYIFNGKAPFIPNTELSKIWGKGFTKITKIKGVVDNLGAYLTAYLTDVKIDEINIKLLDKDDIFNIKEITETDENGKEVKKNVIKGFRLKMYPKGMKIFRTSRKIKRPKVINCTKAEAKKIIGNAPMTYEKTIKIIDDNDIEINAITTQYYNKIRKKEMKFK